MDHAERLLGGHMEAPVALHHVKARGFDERPRVGQVLDGKLAATMAGAGANKEPGNRSFSRSGPMKHKVLTKGRRMAGSPSSSVTGWPVRRAYFSAMSRGWSPARNSLARLVAPLGCVR